MNYQDNFLKPLAVDLFAGGGGASTGWEQATGLIIDIAVNHDKNAIAMHEMNHPFTRHFCENIFKVDPIKATEGRPVDFMWASPDCTHFSKAKGGKPVKKEIRSLAWVITQWASKVRPRIIMAENVPEFVSWGPLVSKRKYGRLVKLTFDENGKLIEKVAVKGENVPLEQRALEPCHKRKGKTFNQFVGHLRNLGYEVDWRVLDASEYGAGTSRKRLYLVARHDGEPITWPAVTHGDKPGLKPKRAAAEFIDFSVRGKSIFHRKKPLAIATQKRIAKGLDKFTIKNKKPFIVPVGYGEAPKQSPRVNDVENSLGTIVASMVKHNIVEPIYSPFIANMQFNNLGQAADKPTQTATSVAKDYIIAPHIQKYFSGETQAGSAADKPLGTATAIDHNALAGTVLAPFISSKFGENGANNVRGKDITEPLPTTSASTVHSLLMAPHMVQYHAETSSDEVRAYGVDEPCKVIDTQPRYGLASAHLMQIGQTGFQNDRSSNLDEPLKTTCTKNEHCLSTASLVQYYSTGKAIDIEKPLPTSTTKDRTALVENHLCVLRNNMDCKAVDEPLPTVTTSPGHFAHIKTYLVKYSPGADLWNWPHVRQLLNEYVGYTIADDEVLILEINGVQHFIGDIEMRMLMPRELYGCQSFPSDYIIDHIIVDGKRVAFPIHEQVKKVGNSVCPVVATALVAANVTWLALKKPFTTMEELYKAVAL